MRSMCSLYFLRAVEEGSYVPNPRKQEDNSHHNLFHVGTDENESDSCSNPVCLVQVGLLCCPATNVGYYTLYDQKASLC